MVLDKSSVFVEHLLPELVQKIKRHLVEVALDQTRSFEAPLIRSKYSLRSAPEFHLSSWDKDKWGAYSNPRGIIAMCGAKTNSKTDEFVRVPIHNEAELTNFRRS